MSYHSMFFSSKFLSSVFSSADRPEPRSSRIFSMTDIKQPREDKPHTTYHDGGGSDAGSGGCGDPRQDRAHVLQGWLPHRRENLSADYEGNCSSTD